MLLIVIGTRPEAIKLAPVVDALRRYPGVTFEVCLSGQHQGMLRPFLAPLGLTAASFLTQPPRHPESEQAQQVRLCAGLGHAIERLSPTAVLVHGDTTTALAGALAAHRRGIAVHHVEAGLRTGDPVSPWPEEIHRVMIARMATLHFAPTVRARNQLLREGVRPEMIEVTGNTVVDGLFQTRGLLQNSPQFRQSLEEKYLSPGAGRRLVLATVHRRENWGRPLQNILTALARLVEEENVHLLFPVHSNPAVSLAVRERLGSREGCALLPPLDHRTLVYLLERMDLVMTDSGGMQEEAAALGTPLLVLRRNTERPEGFGVAPMQLGGTDPEELVERARKLLSTGTVRHPFYGYGDGRAAPRIAARLAAWFKLQAAESGAA
ncbi:MAG: UDP-N-acetylglucosamine 2-epimerase (non-hydrolyzing) [Pseudomonadota bacterium]|nr:UDP-N-acetylglucosamine 2-epimerase (non-hydrolyzing) [Pseudomonadota bacterium]